MSKFIVINSFKISLACLISFLVQNALTNGPGPLMVVSSFLVMIGTGDFGSTLKKSVTRIIGSLIGGLLAILSLAFWNQSLFSNALIILIITFAFALLINQESNKFKPAGILGALTFIFITLSPHNNLYSALQHFEQIILGIFIALLVSGFILPVATQQELKKTLSYALSKLKTLYEVKICQKNHVNYAKNPYKWEEKILYLFAVQRRISSGALMRAHDKIFLDGLFKKIVLCERGIFRAILFLEKISLLYLPNGEISSIPLELERFHSLVAKALAQISTDLNCDLSITAQLNTLLDTFQIIHLQRVHDGLQKDNIVYISTYLGCCRYLVDEIIQLTGLLDHLNNYREDLTTISSCSSSI